MISKAKCAFYKRDLGITFEYPIILSNTESFEKTYLIYQSSPKKPIDLTANKLEKLVSCCLIPLNKIRTGRSVGVPLKMIIEGSIVRLFYNIPELDGLYKLIILFGQRVIYNQVLICYPMEELPQFLQTDPPRQIQIFASINQDLLRQFSKKIKFINHHWNIGTNRLKDKTLKLYSVITRFLSCNKICFLLIF